MTFWLRVNKRQDRRFVLQIASYRLAVGTTVEIDNGIFGVYVNGRTVQRHVAINWTYSTWNFVALTWNKTKSRVGISLNCSSVPYTNDTVKYSYEFANVPPYHIIMLGANNARITSTEMTIDELAVWNGLLSKKDICYIMKAKAGNYKMQQIALKKAYGTMYFFLYLFFSLAKLYSLNGN